MLMLLLLISLSYHVVNIAALRVTQAKREKGAFLEPSITAMLIGQISVFFTMEDPLVNAPKPFPRLLHSRRVDVVDVLKGRAFLLEQPLQAPILVHLPIRFAVLVFVLAAKLDRRTHDEAILDLAYRHIGCQRIEFALIA